MAAPPAWERPRPSSLAAPCPVNGLLVSCGCAQLALRRSSGRRHIGRCERVRLPPPPLRGRWALMQYVRKISCYFGKWARAPRMDFHLGLGPGAEASAATSWHHYLIHHQFQQRFKDFLKSIDAC